MPNEGYQIQVGDKIKFESGCFGEQTFTVHRATKCFAFVRYNDVAEGKFRREYRSFGFAPIGHNHYSRTRFILIPKEADHEY